MSPRVSRQCACGPNGLSNPPPTSLASDARRYESGKGELTLEEMAEAAGPAETAAFLRAAALSAGLEID